MLTEGDEAPDVRPCWFTAKKKSTRRERFLTRMEAVIPWARLLTVIAPHYPKGERGRPPIGLERMLRVYFLQQWYALADEALEDVLYDSQALQRFARIEVDAEGVPDATTLLKFRRLLETRDLCKGLFTAINADLAARGLLLREGRRRLHRLGKTARDRARSRPLDVQVACKRGVLKALAEGAQKEALKAVEHAKAAVRAFVEHSFHIVKNLFRHRKARYRGLAKNAHQLHALFAVANVVIAARRVAA